MFRLWRPLAHPKGDVEQGFPRARVRLLLGAARAAGVGPKDLLQMDEEGKLRAGRARVGSGVTEQYQVDGLSISQYHFHSNIGHQKNLLLA